MLREFSYRYIIINDLIFKIFHFTLSFRSFKYINLFVYSPLEHLAHSQYHKEYGQH